jgi:hypothetical protein
MGTADSQNEREWWREKNEKNQRVGNKGMGIRSGE